MLELWFFYLWPVPPTKGGLTVRSRLEELPNQLSKSVDGYLFTSTGFSSSELSSPVRALLIIFWISSSVILALKGSF
jgi:hypothetical protein